MHFGNIPKELYPRLSTLPVPKEVDLVVKFAPRVATRKGSIGQMYIEYERIVNSPAPLEVFWQAVIKLLHPIRWRRYVSGRPNKVIEYDLFDKAKWEKLKAQPNLNALIWAFGFPLENILPRIWLVVDNRLVRFTMWWERSQNEEATTNANGE